MKTNNTTLQAGYMTGWSSSNPWFVQRLPLLFILLFASMLLISVLASTFFGFFAIQSYIAWGITSAATILLLRKVRNLATAKVKGSVMIVHYALSGKKHVVELQFIRHIRHCSLIGKQGASFNYTLDGKKHTATLLDIDYRKDELCSQLRQLRKAA